MKGNGQTGHGGRFVNHYPDIPFIPKVYTPEELDEIEREQKFYEEHPEIIDEKCEYLWNAFGGGLK